jgi:hypothetical protein
MDSKGSKMTDTTPLVQIKAALQTLKSEIKNFELRIGVVGYALCVMAMHHYDMIHNSILDSVLQRCSVMCLYA